MYWRIRGMRRLDTMNQACLAKLGWKLYIRAVEVWCDVLRGKYDCRNFKEEGVSRASACSLWKNIVKLRPNLKQCCFWAIGNGTGVEAWHDAWIDNGTCCDYCGHEETSLHVLRDCGQQHATGYGIGEIWSNTTTTSWSNTTTTSCALQMLDTILYRGEKNTSEESSISDTYKYQSYKATILHNYADDWLKCKSTITRYKLS
ncbi:hypothetical protein QL285_034003 [Trifolium repens]|nr:hypothetical protein QL285_034003 [Trifolium repens]